jgi:hypothetical protein
MKSRIFATLVLALTIGTGAAIAKGTKAQNTNSSTTTSTTSTSTGMKKHRRHHRRAHRRHRKGGMKTMNKNSNS